MEHNGHDWSVQKQQVLGQLRAGLEHAKSFVESLEERSGSAGVAASPRRSLFPKGKMAAVALAAALDVMARRRSAAPAPARKRRPGIFKLALLSAAVLAAGKLIASRR